MLLFFYKIRDFVLMHDDKQIKTLLKTARGQIDGMLKMIDENRDCIDVSTQIMATQSMLKKINLLILSNHLNHCIRETFENNNEIQKQNKIDEIIGIINKLLK